MQLITLVIFFHSQDDAISNLSSYTGLRAMALQALRTQAKATEFSLA